VTIPASHVHQRFVQFIPAPTAFEANNQFIKVSYRIRAVRKAPDVKRPAGLLCLSALMSNIVYRR
jgi:hypothetical protein